MHAPIVSKMISYGFLQTCCGLLVLLLGALSVTFLFVLGVHSLLGSLGSDAEGCRVIISSTRPKWKFTFITLILFGGAFNLSLLLLYNLNCGYGLWALLLILSVLQTVLYGLQDKLTHAWGARTFQFFFVMIGMTIPFFFGSALGAFFEGMHSVGQWTSASHGLDALLDPWVLLLGFSVLFLARVLGTLYVLRKVNDADIRSRARVRLTGSAIAFTGLFGVYLIHLLINSFSE